ncbi:MAG: phosphate starvation-inducible protein PhoH [Micavibrio sp. TMED27]|nr:phosphate starvation-inducible protein PhoH [Micavibrio sp.]OUT92524.1 MAG: phosphate starvation-inducible protein PhoH [Micavibrio sp. TMED27]|tara:strand:+ start:1047 stop:1802 length:756 start_codon:yes stop_codon:yes gene_type:complete
MSKKSRKSRNSKKDNTVFHPAFDHKSQSSDWHPMDDEINGRRDQKYVKNIKPRSEGQAELIKSIEEYSLTMAVGPAGTGKTYLAISKAAEALEKGEIERIILSRPAMEAGESLGYLPGDMQEKMAPYLRPLYDSLGDRMGGKKVRQYIEDGTIEIAPIGFMRGRTLNNSFIVIDEAQNCTYGQLKMILSRLGWHSTMVVTGDPEQSDLLDGMSGLADISRRLDALENVAVCRLNETDIVRHPLVADMLGVL